MDEVIKALSEKFGLSEDQARQAVETVLGFLKDKLPPALGDQLENIIDGKADDNMMNQLNSLLGGNDGNSGIGGALGSLFGKK